MLKNIEPKNLSVYKIDYTEKSRIEYINIPKELVESDIKAMQYAEALFYAGLMIEEDKLNEPLGIVQKR